MSLILNDVHLPFLIQSMLLKNDQYIKTLPWNTNLDRLSCLWAVFTKYKRTIQDGFRLENLSWRLWYRQSILQKKASGDMDVLTTTATGSKQLPHRTRSLPNLSQWSHQKQLLKNSEPNINLKQKFFIRAAMADDKEQNQEQEEQQQQQQQEQEQLVFTKKPTSKFNNFSSTATCALSKPVSLLTDMLQRTESNVSLATSSELRRCQSRYCRLDQFFLNAA